MNILYLAKEPGPGVMGDLKQFDEHKITVFSCLPGYNEYYKTLGYNTITKLDDLEDMRFDVVIGNPPYQQSGHKAKTSSMWKVFLEKADELCDGVISLIIPASFCSPTKLFAKYKNRLSLLDFTVKKYFKGVGSSFVLIRLEKDEQSSCKIVTDSGEYHLDLHNWDCVPSTLNDELMSYINQYFDMD